MATQTYPYYITQNVPPGERRELTWGPSSYFAEGTFTITAHPIADLFHTLFWLTVDDISMGTIDVGAGDISNIQSYLWVKVRNDGYAFQGTVKSYTVYVTRAIP